jgi:hypothetical protein
MFNTFVKIFNGLPMKQCGKQEYNTDVIHTCICKRVMTCLSKAILFS